MQDGLGARHFNSLWVTAPAASVVVHSQACPSVRLWAPIVSSGIELSAWASLTPIIRLTASTARAGSSWLTM